MENLKEMLKGILEGCVLEIINQQDTYGYEITRRLNTLGFTDVVEGTVYTILIRLERNKLVNIQKRKSELGPPRKFYSLNDAGRRELKNFLSGTSKPMATILDSAFCFRRICWTFLKNARLTAALYGKL